VNSNTILAACDRLIVTCEHALSLDENNRAGSGDTIREPLIPYVLAQLRMRIRPALTPAWLTHDPVHIALLGGTNSGKSTLVNVLLGRAAAGMQVTARFSQHPEAYRPPALGDQWLTAFPSRFAGYQLYRDEHPPRQPDDALVRGRYHLRFAVLDAERAPGVACAPLATRRAVCWDVPDFSTEEARAYLRTVLDVIALADVVIMTVTDESYADDRGRVLFRMVQDSGVTLYVVANKLISSPDLLADIRAKYLETNESRHGQGPALLPVQFYSLQKVEGKTPEERLSNLLATHEAEQLRAAIAREGKRGTELKRHTLAGAVHCIERHLEEVLRPLVAELEMATAWEKTVTRITRGEFLDQYRSEYLNSQRYGEFNQALIHLMELLEIPWVGPLMKLLRGVIRTPLRLVTGLLGRFLFGGRTVDSEHRPEHEVVAKLFETCLTALKSEAQTLANTRTHPAWTGVVQKIEDQDFHVRLVRTFEAAYVTYRQDLATEVRRRSREIYAAVEQNPTLLTGLRSANVAVDAATLFLVIKSGGFDWSDTVVGPIVAGLRRVLLDAGMEAYLEHQKRTLQQYQFEAIQRLVLQHLVQPVCDLFAPELRADEIDQAHQDFALVKEAALRVAQGAER
jgi:hypothetical protein